MRLTIARRIVSTFCFHTMESLETQKRAIELGKLLVKQLAPGPHTDTLSEWMAHYIAEQVALAESTEDASNKEAKAECFRTIMDLWEHRAKLPQERQPFGDFEPIFRALERLNPETSAPFFHRVKTDDTATSAEADPVRGLLKLVDLIDYAARVFIYDALEEAAKQAVGKEAKEFLAHAVESHNAPWDVRVIVRLAKEPEVNGLECNKRELRAAISKKVERLKAFESESARFRAQLQRELREIR